MMQVFCPKCGGILVPKKRGNRIVIMCSKCGYIPKEKTNMTFKENVEKEGDIPIVDEEEATAYPVVEQKCPKCGYDKAYFWTVQTRAGDEPETKFYRCKKCGHTWRDYS